MIFIEKWKKNENHSLINKGKRPDYTDLMPDQL